MDVFSTLGELALGSRLRRLSDYIMQDVSGIYRNNHLDFDPKWFPLYYLLSEEEGLAITEIAARIGISHPGLIKLAKELEKAGYVESVQDKQDKRRRILSLSKKGRSILPQMREVWKDIAACVSALLQQQEQHLLKAVIATEQRFKEDSLSNRVRKFRNARLLDAVEIIPYEARYGSYFKAFNYAWIERYFRVEPIDMEVLEQHQEKIIQPGGCILFAKIGEDIVGTCALKKTGEGWYELTKMAVTESAQGKQVGKKLGLAILAKARAMGGQGVFLESNRKLTPALRLYRRLGFKEVSHPENEESEYVRSDIRMEIRL